MSARTPTRWREQFISDAARHGLNLEQARAWLRVAATAQRLNEAQCNGDWPADNGERPTKTCADCARYWHPSAIRKDGRCIDCHNDDRARKLLPNGWKLETGGDPRGCAYKLHTPNGYELGVP